ncbi:MAG: thiaminase II [Chloroherpetonaceae bacterium]|nr:thiaminase II [Chloroherpetonaceae bacterium]
MRFTDSLWTSIDTIYHEILRHPFNQELLDGTLPQEKFQFYMKQDALYLTDFAKALALIAARSDSAEQIVDFVRFSEGAIVAERGLHEFYFDLYQTKLDVTYAPACFMYTNYMLASAATRPIEVAAAALLPCFWIYREVGNVLYKQVSTQASYDEHPYKKWIDMYSGEEYGAVVEKMLAITERMATETTDEIRTKMKEAFVNSSRLEWLFWESAYHLETWKPQ